MNLVHLDPLGNLVPQVVLDREASLGHKVLREQEVHLENVDRMELPEEMDSLDREENKDHKVLRVNQDLQDPVVNQVREATLEHVENLDYLAVMVSREFNAKLINSDNSNWLVGSFDCHLQTFLLF